MRRRILKSVFHKRKSGKDSALNLNYTPKAIADLDSIHAYIAQDSERAAEQVITRILQSMSILETYPLIGREGRIEDTREWSIKGLPYVGIYSIADELNVDVIAVIHTAMQFPPEGV